MEFAGGNLFALARNEHGFTAGRGARVEKVCAGLHRGANGNRPHGLESVIPLKKTLVADKVFEDMHVFERGIYMRFTEVYVRPFYETYADALGRRA